MKIMDKIIDYLQSPRNDRNQNGSTKPGAVGSKKRGKTILGLCLLTMVLLASTTATAQLSTLDFYANSDGTPLEGVSYLATNIETRETFTNTTDSTGWTTLTLPAGNYSISAYSALGTETIAVEVVENQDYNFQTQFAPETTESSSGVGWIIGFIVFCTVALLMFIYFLTTQKDVILGVFNSSSATEFAKSKDRDERAGKAIGGILKGGLP